MSEALHTPAFAGLGRDSPDLAGVEVRFPRVSRLGRAVQWGHPRVAAAAESLALDTVGALLEHLPRDRREARTIAELEPGEQATVIGEVRSVTSRPVRRRGMKPLVEATVADPSGTLKAVFFNQPWLARRYGPGTRLLLHGKYEARNRFKVSHHAPTEEAAVDAGEVAHYPATDGLTSTQILAQIQRARLEIHDVVEPLPAALRVAERLPDRPSAIGAVHFAPGREQAERGRRRLAFEELLLAQLVFLRRRRARRERAAAIELSDAPTLTARWREQSLPFVLTGDQQAAVAQIVADLADRHPMQRLLMGEVGSGKTVVAFHAMLRAVEHDAQAVLMAPTETLAQQHFATLQKLAGSEPVTLALITGSTPAARRSEALARLAGGELSMVVGTHALVEPDVVFARLALAVVDEQHRFGVRQRAALDAKGPAGLAPHVLHMTATPIPRTLALARYGDLDVTALRELPRGRQPIATRVVSGDRDRARAYEHIRGELRAGRQAFVVCPLVEESEALAARAATAEYERLAHGELRDFRCMLMHGQMRPREKEAAMAEFVAGRADVLVATSVIEVGIDVPNATVMLVEDAERYGISQLHQLRGRVGRGEHQSVCLLFGARDSARLRALADHDDGFRLAEIDLDLRHEGELTGVRQSGAGEYRFARMPQDRDLIERAQACARAILEADPELSEPEHALLEVALAGERWDPIPA